MAEDDNQVASLGGGGGGGEVWLKTREAAAIHSMHPRSKCIIRETQIFLWLDTERYE